MKKILLGLILFFSVQFSFGQGLGGFNPAPLIAGSEADAQYLAQGYLKPLGNALAVGLNNGWYSTAKTHKLGRFDLMMTTSLLFIPSGDQTFMINNSDLQSLELVNSATAESPTAFGEANQGPRLRIQNDVTNGSAFNAPQGSGFTIMPVLMAGINIGLVKNTDIGIRYLPSVKVPLGDVEGSIDMFGFSVKHDFLQWIPVADKLPIDASVFFGYTKLNYEQELSGDGQSMTLTSTGYTGRILVSKKLLFFTPFVGLGFNSASTDMNIKGNFTYNDPTAPGGTRDLDFDATVIADDASGFVGNVGFKLKFLFVMAFTADYTFGAYNSVNAGLGFSIDF
jgi:hypothetical protein